jgi:hypothetical protein
MGFPLGPLRIGCLDSRPALASGRGFLDAQMRPRSELEDRLLAAIRSWQRASMTQQDDVTLVVIDLRWLLLQNPAPVFGES